MSSKIKKAIATVMVVAMVICAAPLTGMNFGLIFNSRSSAVSQSSVKSLSDNRYAEIVPMVEETYKQSEKTFDSQVFYNFIYHCSKNEVFAKYVSCIIDFAKNIIEIIKTESESLKKIVGQYKGSFKIIPAVTHELYYLTDELIERLLKGEISLDELLEYLNNNSNNPVSVSAVTHDLYYLTDESDV